MYRALTAFHKAATAALLATLLAVQAVCLSAPAAAAEQGYLGVELRDLGAEHAKMLGLDPPRGAVFVKAAPGAPAEKADLKPGDVLLEAEGLTIPNTKGFVDFVRSKPPGTTLQLILIRGEERKIVTVTLGSHPNSTLYRGLDLFGDIFERIQAGRRGGPDDASLMRAAVDGMLANYASTNARQVAEEKFKYCADNEKELRRSKQKRNAHKYCLLDAFGDVLERVRNEYGHTFDAPLMKDAINGMLSAIDANNDIPKDTIAAEIGKIRGVKTRVINGAMRVVIDY